FTYSIHYSPSHLTTSSLSFFFQCSRPHRHLHSFPTRRSSDLPYRKDRDLVRALHVEGQLPFIEIHANTPIETCEQRDPKGLYKKDRKSTRLNSSHRTISYAVFCLKKKKKKHQ